MNANLISSVAETTSVATSASAAVAASVTASGKSFSTLAKVGIGCGIVGAVVVTGVAAVKVIKAHKEAKPKVTVTRVGNENDKREIVRDPDVAPAVIQIAEKKFDEDVAAMPGDFIVAHGAFKASMQGVKTVITTQPASGTITRVLQSPEDFKKAKDDFHQGLGKWKKVMMEATNTGHAGLADGRTLLKAMDAIYANTTLPVWAVETLIRRSLDVLEGQPKEAFMSTIKVWQPKAFVSRKMNDAGVLVDVLDAETAIKEINDTYNEIWDHASGSY